MAPRMKYWIAMVAVGMVLVAAWRLPPGSMERREVTVPTAKEIRYGQLGDDYRWTSEALRRVRWSDSLSALIMEREDRGMAVAVPTGSALDGTMLGHLQDAVREQLDALDVRSPEMTFGLVYQPYDHAREGDMPISQRPRTETYVGTREGIAYCMQVRVHDPNSLTRAVARAAEIDEDALPRGSASLGPCHFYLQYGAASGQMQEWLEGGGLRFATRVGSRPSATGRTIDPFPRYGIRYMFGSSLLSFNRTMESDQCTAGMPEACAKLFINPLLADPVSRKEQKVVKRSPVAFIGGLRIQAFTIYGDQYLLADLEAEFGAEAFRRFWTSEEGVAESFEAAFGVDVGNWLVTWIESIRPIHDPGPGLPRSASSGSMLAVSLLVGLAYMRNRKRRLS